jgi:hypothetical protein
MHYHINQDREISRVALHISQLTGRVCHTHHIINVKPYITKARDQLYWHPT